MQRLCVMIKFNLHQIRFAAVWKCLRPEDWLNEKAHLPRGRAATPRISRIKGMKAGLPKHHYLPGLRARRVCEQSCTERLQRGSGCNDCAEVLTVAKKKTSQTSVVIARGAGNPASFFWSFSVDIVRGDDAPNLEPAPQTAPRVESSGHFFLRSLHAAHVT